MSFKSRIRLISGILVLLTTVLVYRLYSLQIVQGESFREQADRQYVSAPSKTFERGSIFFTTKDGTVVSGATLQSGYYMAIVPKEITEPEDLFNLLSSVVTLNEVDFMKKAQKKDDPFEEVAKNLTSEQASRIASLGQKGVRLYKDKWRYYPFAELASQTVGFVGYDDKTESLSGRYGLERYYEDLLSRDGSSSKVNFFADVFLNLKENIFDSEQKGDLVTSIEPSVQGYLDGVINKVQKTYSSKITGGIIMDPKTGEILALGSYPSFDPNNFGSVKDVSVFSNPLTENVYEMGSVIKPLTVAVGLDSGAITEQTTYIDKGSVTYNGKTISNHDKLSRGLSTIQDILSHSLNVGASFIAESVGTEKFPTYFKSFGIGQKSGIDLPNESSGLTKNLDSNRMIELATASFGQGIALSPMSLIKSLSSLANEGKMVTPHIGVSIKNKSGISKKIEYPAPVQVMKKETAQSVTNMLIKAVDEALNSGKSKIDNYTVAAKTGTAQIADAKNGGYYADKFLHSFFGYFPARNPEFIVFLFTVEPKGVQYASDTLTASFMDIAKFLLHYYEIVPDRQNKI